MSYKYLLILFTALVTLNSCEKKEQAYPMPEMPELSDSAVEDQVALGGDYATQIYYSFKNGFVTSNPYAIWDICFSTGADSTEMWLNGGKLILLYVTEATQFADITSSYVIDSKKWKYDKTSSNKGESALGFLEQNSELNKVWLLSVKNEIYKLKVKDVSSSAVTIEVAKGLGATTGTTHVLNKDSEFNFVYFNVESGIEQPEPPKANWDILFTRYRYIYEKYNPDDTDFLYGVTGVLINPYKTLGASDSVKTFDYFTFTKDTLDQHMNLVANRDVIGWNWKEVDINTAKYVALSKQIFVVKDQNGVLWKMHFLSYTNNLGENGYPKFRYEPLK